MGHRNFDLVTERVRNWGRWGPDDARGTLNHIGPEALQRAAREVRSGKSFTLGLPFDGDGPQDDRNRPNPDLSIVMVAQPIGKGGRTTFSDDFMKMPLQCATQWDALSHVHYDGEMYNGCKVCDSIGQNGVTRHGIEHLANPGIVSRGVLIDVARHFKVDRLPAAYEISIDDLRAVLDAQGTAIMPGDIVLVRTGQIQYFTVDKDRDRFLYGGSGLHFSCAEYLHDVSAAALAADNISVEYVDIATMDDSIGLPLHVCCLREMGMPLGEMFDMEALAADCAADERYSFMLSAAPLAFTGAVGSPVNPIALK